MKAVVWTGARRMEIQDLPVPVPGPGELLVRVDSVGICGSELSGYLGQNSLRVPPLVMGHEFAGTAAGIGSGVTNFKENDPLIVNPLITCGTCRLCRMDLDSLCPDRKLIGAHQPGAFAEFVIVPAGNCTRLPTGLDLLSGALAEPLACGVRSGKLAGVRPGDRVAVIGAGTIGLFAMAAVRNMGGEIVLASEVNPGRLAMAGRWGAANAINPRESDVVAETKKLTGGLGADVVLDAVGSSSARRSAIEMVRPGGTVVMVGLHEAESALQANLMIRSEIHLTGSFAYTPDDFSEAVDLLAGGLIRPSREWLDERPLDACDPSFIELIDSQPSIAKIILHP